MTRRVRDGLRNEDGVGVVELIVYIALAAMISGTVVAVFITGLQSESATRQRDAATASAQLISNSVQKSIRNSSGFDVSGSLLRAKVAVGSGTGWVCEAWRLTSAGGALEHKTSSSLITAGESGWATLATGVSGTVVPDQPFERDGSRLQFRLQVTTGVATAQVGAAVTAQAFGEGGTQCW